MIGIIALVIVLMWIIIGKRWRMTSKVMLAFLILLSYILFLKLQGATNYEIIEILFPFYSFYR